MAMYVGFQYRIQLVKDGYYGAKTNDSKRWNGMIGELIAKVSLLNRNGITYPVTLIVTFINGKNVM